MFYAPSTDPDRPSQESASLKEFVVSRTGDGSSDRLYETW